MMEQVQFEREDRQYSERDSKERLAQLCDIWYDLSVDAQFSLAASTTAKVLEHLSKGRKSILVGIALVAAGVTIYLASGNWALAFVLGVLFGLVMSWIISR